MDGHPITLRAATPTFREGLAFAHFLDQAAEGFFHFLLGRRAHPILAEAFSRTDHDLSFQYVTFAERDGAIVGMVAGYTAAQHRRSCRQPLAEAAGRHHLRLRVLSMALAPLMRIIDTVPEDASYLQAIAVATAVRGRGVGGILMDAFEERARACGSARIALDVSARNETALRFYERRGMTVASRWPRRLPVPGLTFFRLSRSL